MLNDSFLKYFPKVLVENITPDGQALVDWLDTNVTLWKSEILEMRYLKVAERMPTEFLYLMDQYLEAGFLPESTEAEKRSKIYDAIQSHRWRGTWANDVKIVVDGVAGYNSTLYTDDTWDAIWYGDGTEDATLYWSTWAGDGLDDDLGTLLCGDIENEIYGIVYIDSGIPAASHLYTADSVITGDGSFSATEFSAIGGDGVQNSMYISGDGALTPAILLIYDRINLNLQDVVPAYYRVFLGYLDGAGKYVVVQEV